LSAAALKNQIAELKSYEVRIELEK
jgi:hypothetical protein